jgi:hypothetical protein
MAKLPGKSLAKPTGPKVICRPERANGKPGPKTVVVKRHIRSMPAPLPKCK